MKVYLWFNKEPKKGDIVKSVMKIEGDVVKWVDYKVVEVFDKIAEVENMQLWKVDVVEYSE